MATIAEIRAQYPQYSDMSDAALADALYKKFYSDLPRADFDAKIGLQAPRSEGMPGPRATLPSWAKEYPNVYQTAVRARQLAGPTAEMLGAVGGGLLGAAAGTFGAGPVGTAAGGVTGSALGYGIAKQGMEAADVALGLKPPPESVAKQTLENVLEGAAYEVGGRLAAPVINKLVNLSSKGVGGLIDLNKLPTRFASQIAKESLGSPQQVSAARSALQVPEAQGLTAQQALARANLLAPGAQATIEKAIKQTTAVDKREVIEAAQEAARRSTIEGVTPDLQNAITARRAASKPFYEAADKAVVSIDNDLADVISRMPSGTLAQAANIAKMEGRPFIIGKTTPPKTIETGVLDAAGNPITKEVPGKTAEITGESLHYIKRALSDIAYGPTAATGAGRDTQLAARTLLNDYIKVFETKVPEYGQARQIFSDLSAPVNQAQVLKEMLSVLEKPGGGERIGPFLNVLGRGEQAMLKRAAGRGGARFESLSEVLTPEQLSKVREVAKLLETQTVVKQEATAGQQRASDLIKDELPNYRLPNVFNVLATTTNKILDTIGLRVGKKAIEKLAEASLTAKSFDELLATLPNEERVKVLKAINDPATWAKIKPAIPKAGMLIGGYSQVPEMPVINNLAPETTNALTER